MKKNGRTAVFLLLAIIYKMFYTYIQFADTKGDYE